MRASGFFAAAQLLIGSSVVCTTLAGAAEAPVAVSPGHPDRIARVEASCPTFHWGAVAGADAYELVVYRLTDETSAEMTELVLREIVPGSALGWTPALESCLERGGRYGWAVRALGVGEEPEWSAPALFEVAAPTELELRDALAVVRSYLAAEGESEIDSASEAAGRPSGSGSAPAAAAGPPAAEAEAAAALVVDLGVEAASFKGDGSELTALDPANLSAGTAAIDISGNAATATTASTADTASDLACVDCVSEPELDFDPASQAELDAHAVGNPDAHHAPPTSLPPSGPAGGDLEGFYPNPTVVNAIARDAEVVAGIESHRLDPDAHFDHSSLDGFERQVFTADGTWVRPAGVDLVWVTMSGGGGQGGASGSVSVGAGGGGAGQTYVRYPVAVSGDVAVVVGQGGTGCDAGAAGDGADGTASSFGALVAAGGKGGLGNGGVGGAGGGGFCAGGEPGVSGSADGADGGTLSDPFAGCAAGGGGGFGTTGRGGDGGGFTGGAGGPASFNNAGGGAGGGVTYFGVGGAGGDWAVGVCNCCYCSGYGIGGNGTGFGAGGGGSMKQNCNTCRSCGAPGMVIVEWFE